MPLSQGEFPLWMNPLNCERCRVVGRALLHPWIVVLLGAIAVWLLAKFGDEAAGLWILERRQHAPWAGLRWTLWPLGSGLIQAVLIVLVTVAATALKRRTVAGIARWLLLSFVLAALLATAIKWTVRRPRPEHMHDPRPHLAMQIDSSEWHSFPSGDVLVTTALVVVLCGLLGGGRWRYWLMVVPPLVGLQRFAAGRHYPSDILAGILLGILLGRAVLHRASRGRQPAPVEAMPPGDEP